MTTTTGSQFPFFHQRFIDNNGKPLSLGKIYFYSAGSVIPKDVFNDKALTIPAQNPLTLDSAGLCPEYFAIPNEEYDIKITDQLGNIIATPKRVTTYTTSNTQTLDLDNSGWVYYDNSTSAFSTSSSTLPTANNSGYLYFDISASEYSYRDINSDTYKVKIDSQDNEGYIGEKLIDSDSIDVEIVNGSNKIIKFNSLGKVKTSSNDNNDYLNTKFIDSSEIKWTFENDKVKGNIQTSAIDSNKVKVWSGDLTPDYLMTKFEVSESINMFTNLGTNKISFAVNMDAIPNTGDHRTICNISDTYAGYLEEKIVGVGPVLVTTESSGQDRQIHIDVPDIGKVKLSESDELDYLQNKIKAGSGITITSASDINGTKLYINSRTNSWRPLKYVSNNYVVQDTDDTIVVRGNFSNVTLPAPSTQYEGRLITVQAAGIGYGTTVIAASGSIVGSGTTVYNYSKVECICVSDGSSWIWIAR